MDTPCQAPMVKSPHGNTRKSGSPHHGQQRPAQQGRRQGTDQAGQVWEGAGKASRVFKVALGLRPRGAIARGQAIAGLAMLASRAFDLGDELDKMSKRTGFSVEALGELKFAAEQSGLADLDTEKAPSGWPPPSFDAGKGSRRPPTDAWTPWGCR